MEVIPSATPRPPKDPRSQAADEPAVAAEPAVEADEPGIEAAVIAVEVAEPAVKADEPAVKADEPAIEADEPPPTLDQPPPTLDQPVAAEAPASADPAEDARPVAGPTLEQVLARADSYWQAFRALAHRFPFQRIDEPLSAGWTRKQMLAHVAAWHDLTTERLMAFTKSGADQPLATEVDVFNSRIARAAIGRTSGEVLGALDASYNRLRRTISQLTDEQLRAHDGWAVAVIGGNTYEHYDEHAADLGPADLSSSR